MNCHYCTFCFCFQVSPRQPEVCVYFTNKLSSYTSNVMAMHSFLRTLVVFHWFSSCNLSVALIVEFLFGWWLSWLLTIFTTWSSSYLLFGYSALVLLWESEERCRYNNSLRAWRSGFRIPVEARDILFFISVQPSRGAHQASRKMGIRAFSRGSNSRDVLLTTHSYLAPKLRMSVAKFLLPLCVFMSCYGVTLLLLLLLLLLLCKIKED